MTQATLQLTGAVPCLGAVILSLACASCGYAPAPRGELIEAATQAMDLWKRGDFEGIYNSADQTMKNQRSKAQWTDSMRLIESTFGRPVSYRIDGIESLEPRPMGMLLFPNKRWGVKVSITSGKTHGQTGLEYVDRDRRMMLYFINSVQDSDRPHTSG